jgi:glutamate 5-kinase
MIEYNVITSWEVIMQRPAFTEGEFSWPDVQCEAIRIEDKFRMKSETGYKRVIVKIGSSSLTHEETGKLDLGKMEQLVRQLSDLRNRGMDVCLVSSGAIAVGRSAMGIHERPTDISMKQACAAVGQAKLMMVYQKLFAEYNETAGQVLLTKNTMINPVSRENAKNTFEELFQLGVIPIVNENDTTSTYEMQFGDNDTLSALVSSMVGADLLILLSDIDGLYTDDPHTNPDAKLVQVVENLDEEILGMAKGTTGSNVGTGGMTTKLTAAKIATLSGTDMIIANGADVKILVQIFEDAYTGTLFKSNKNANFNLATYVMETIG